MKVPTTGSGWRCCKQDIANVWLRCYRQDSVYDLSVVEVLQAGHREQQVLGEVAAKRTLPMSGGGSTDRTLPTAGPRWRCCQQDIDNVWWKCYGQDAADKWS